MLQRKESTAFKMSGERKQKPNNPCQPEFSIQNFLSAPIFGERKKEQVALKLNRPKDKRPPDMNHRNNFCCSVFKQN